MAQVHGGNPFNQQQDLLEDPFPQVDVQPAPAAANLGALLQAAMANGNPAAPLPPAYANLIVAMLQAAAAQGVNLFGAPLAQVHQPVAANNDAMDALVQAADGNQARRRAAGNARARDAAGGNGRLDAGSGSGSRNGSESGNGNDRHSAAGQETMSEVMTKAKSVLTQPFVFTSLVYSLVISFSLSIRGNQMSMVNGRPVDSVGHIFLAGPDKWITTSAMDLLIACLAFLVILMAHFYLILHFMMKRPAGAPAMQRYYSSFVPIMLTLATELYYCSYMSLTRYFMDTREWIILGVFSAVMICGSVNIIACPPIRQEKIVVTERVHIV